MAVQNTFFGQLESVASCASDGASLVLFDAEGTELARFITSDQG